VAFAADDTGGMSSSAQLSGSKNDMMERGHNDGASSWLLEGWKEWIGID
jgi:hypothetical protein